jgi:hypothetical protein
LITSLCRWLQGHCLWEYVSGEELLEKKNPMLLF